MENFRGKKLFQLFGMIIFLILVVGLVGCGGKVSVRQDQEKLQQGAKIKASLDRLYGSLQLNPDGTVSLNEKGTGFLSLTNADKAFGKALLAALNQKIAQGLIRVNNDFSINWLGPASSNAQSLKGASCDTNWWGESCKVDPSTTKDVCTGLLSGEGALIICSLIPVVDTACEIIEIIGALPLEAEICPCADSNCGSIFHVTWIGACWFTCN